MGLFTNQPEQPDEWAGLPSEPLRPETDAELLGGGLEGSVADSVLFGGAASIVISVAPVAPVGPVVPVGETDAEPGSGEDA